jgi:hypothetical protein
MSVTLYLARRLLPAAPGLGRPGVITHLSDDQQQNPPAAVGASATICGRTFKV